MKQFLMLPRSVQAYVLLIVLCGTAMACVLATQLPAVRVAPGQLPILILISCLVAAATDLREIRTPGGDRKTVVSTVFIAAILLLGPLYTLPAVVFGNVGSYLWQRKPWFKVMFNIGMYTLVVGVSGLIYQAVGRALQGQPNPDFDSGAGILALLALAVTYFILNSGLVSAVVALAEGEQILRVWNLTHVDVLVQYAGMVILGIIVALVWEVAPWATILVGAVLVVIYWSFALAESLQEAQRAQSLRMVELQRRTAELTLLNNVAGAMVRGVDLGPLSAVIYEQVSRVFDIARFLVILQDDRDGALRVAFGRDGEVDVAGQEVPADAPVVIAVTDRRRAVVLSTADELPLDQVRLLSGGSQVTPRSTIAASLDVGPLHYGVLVVQSERPRAYTVEDARVLTGIADQIALVIDQTRLKREVAEMRALRRLNALKAEFVSTVSHELRSPLTPILGFSELILHGEYTREAVREMAGEIYREARHMHKLVDDLLDASHLEAGRFRIEVERFDLQALLEREVGEFRRQTVHHQLLMEIPRRLPPVEGDAMRLRQVIDNLLSNALKYSPRGGRVAVEVGYDEREVTVTVRDEGIGLRPDQIDRLFEMFYRADNSLTHRVRGNGLGLAIAKHIIEDHGGRMRVESEPGKGSAFAFTVPLRQVGLPPVAISSDGRSDAVEPEATTAR